MDRYVQSMVINITAICNMECAFCLRGDAHEKKLDLSLIPKMFEGIRAVESLTLTGGEPSTYPEAVTAIKDYILDHRDELDVNGMFIATNAKVYCQGLVDAVKEVMYLHIEKIYGDKTIDFGSRNMPKAELEECRYRFNVVVSLDRYHEPIEVMNYSLGQPFGCPLTLPWMHCPAL